MIDMAKYKVGDRVIVRKDLNVIKRYRMEDSDFLEFVAHPMLNFRGQVVTIKKVRDYGYAIEEDNAYYNWTDEMFEGLAKEEEKEKQKPEVVTPEFDNTIEAKIKIEKVIFNDPATIIFYRVPLFSNGEIIEWSELKKSVAKCNKIEGDVYNKKVGLSVAVLKAFKKEIEKELSKY
jgi:hypothetical protein